MLSSKVHDFTLLKVFISWKSFLVESLGLLMYKVMSSAKKEILTSSFPFSILFYFVFLFIIPTKTSINVLNRSGNPYLVFDFNGNVFFVCHGISYRLVIKVFIILRLVPSIPVTLRYLSWKGTRFCLRVFFVFI